MSEAAVIARTGSRPVTVDTLVEDLAALGLQQGMVVLVHSSLSSLGWVCGGPVAVIRALETILEPAGTLVMPAHSGDLSDPALWVNPPVPREWWEMIRQSMPAFDPDLTPTRGMGVIAECFRKMPGVLRSYHPQVSFAARGRYAAMITASHSLAYGLGEGSPLARIYDLDGWVLLLGVGHGNNTSLHLAEYRASYPGKKTIVQGAPIIDNSVRRWAGIPDLDLDCGDFEQLGEAFNATGQVRQGTVGCGRALLMRQRPLVDFAVRWMEENRQPPATDQQ
ncbi:MAG: AAC(3) family N-acetyltransferase [Anaerolineae bacterium]|nr:AAC(3) family N-acetyltransferase [Anaerolineae bacterium]